MRWRFEDLHIQDGRKPAQALRADAEIIDGIIQFDAQFLDRRLRPARFQFGHVDRLHQRLLGQDHRLFGRAADADAQHARRAPAGAHQWHGVHHPIADRIAGVEHGELGLVLATAAFGRHGDLDMIARHQLDVDHGRRVVAGVHPGEGRIGDDGGAQLVFGVQIGAAHAFVHHFLNGFRGLPGHVHANFYEGHHDAGILADRAVAFGTHAAVGEDLGDGVLRGRRFFQFIGAAQGANIIHRVEIADVLQRIGHGGDDILFADHGHGANPVAFWSRVDGETIGGGGFRV